MKLQGIIDIKAANSFFYWVSDIANAKNKKPASVLNRYDINKKTPFLNDNWYILCSLYFLSLKRAFATKIVMINKQRLKQIPQMLTTNLDTPDENCCRRPAFRYKTT